VASTQGSTVTISAQQLSWVVEGLRALDADVATILERAGVIEAELQEPEARFDPALEYALWNAALEVTGDPCLGLHMARAMRPGSFGTVDYMLRHQSTLRGALEQMQRFGALLDPRFSAQADSAGEGEGESVRVSRDGGFPQPDVECLFATIVMLCATKLPGYTPLQIRFVHRRKGPLETYEDFFPCEVVFGADHNEIRCAAGTLDAPLRRVDLALGRILEEHATKMLDELPVADPFVLRARRALLDDIADGGPSLDALATRLGVSTRTLRRRLQDHGTSYKELLDELRKELGCRYVLNSDHGFEEVAALLGYVDSRTFYRNFKRWTGKTPAAYRKQG